MGKSTRKAGQSKAKPKEYAVVVFAQDMEEAREYEAALKADGIPVFIKESYESELADNGIAVLVPEDYVDEAGVIIESQSVYDDLFDFSMDDDDDFDGFDDDELF